MPFEKLQSGESKDKTERGIIRVSERVKMELDLDTKVLKELQRFSEFVEHLCGVAPDRDAVMEPLLRRFL